MRDFAYEVGLPFEDMPPMDVQILWGIVGGFLREFGIADYEHMMPLIAHLGLGLNTSAQMQQRELLQVLPEENPQLFHFIFRFDPNAVDDERYFSGSSQQDAPPLFQMEVIYENKIAYVSLSSFFYSRTFRYRAYLNEFYYYIKDYEHLIIDIRESSGGFGHIGFEYFMYPLSYTENLSGNPLFVFFADSDTGDIALINSRIGGLPIVWYTGAGDFSPIDDILSAHYLPLLNESDIASVAYGIVVETRLNSEADFLSQINRSPFNGRIWLLISEQNYSSSAIFAHHARDMGFATLVGETVGGGITLAATSTMILPNSGMRVQWDIDYITDHHGRSLVEFPTEPHYFNLEGMDALETVLYLIENIKQVE